jgi:GntR family transcriptional regulator, hexuronate regulon transcriptional repressor
VKTGLRQRGAEGNGKSGRLYQQIAQQMSEAIKRGDWRRGQRMPSERDLAEQYGVSRPTVREAIIALELSGLVEVRQGSGVYVTGWTKESAAEARRMPELDTGAFELTEARRIFEGEAAALAAAVINEEQLKQLTGLYALMADKDTPDEEADRADRQFHVGVAKATGNSAIVSVVESLWDMRYASPLCRAILARAAIMRPVAREHQSILKALKARDPQAARVAMREHLGDVIDALLKATEIESVQKVKSDLAAKRSRYARRAKI